MIPLLPYLTLVGALNDSFTTPWIRNPRPELQNAELWISVKTVHGGQLDLVLQSSPDKDQVTSVSTSNLNAVGETVTSITSRGLVGSPQRPAPRSASTRLTGRCTTTSTSRAPCSACARRAGCHHLGASSLTVTRCEYRHDRGAFGESGGAGARSSGVCPKSFTWLISSIKPTWLKIRMAKISWASR